MAGVIRPLLKEFYAKFSIWGTNSSSEDAPLRVNSERSQLQIEPVENWTQIDPVVLGTSANTVIWNPGSTAAETYLVDLLAHSFGAGDQLVRIALDANATGAATHYFLRGYLPLYMSTGWIGPFVIAGNDDVMAWTTNAAAVVVHLRVRKVHRSATS